MPVFDIRPAFPGKGVARGRHYHAIKIVIDAGNVAYEHGGQFAVSIALTSDREVDEAVDSLISDLELVRTIAKKNLNAAAWK